MMDNLAIGNTKEYVTLVVKVQEQYSQLPENMNQVILADKVFITANFDKHGLSLDNTDSLEESVKFFEDSGIELVNSGEKIENLKNLVLEESKKPGVSLIQNQDLQTQLITGLRALIDSNEPTFYSIPAQSVVKIGESKF